MNTRSMRTDEAKAEFHILIYDLCEQEFGGSISQGLMTLTGSLYIRGVMTISN